MTTRKSHRRRNSWATATTLKESRAVTLDFVAHHKSLGADAIHLFFDDPDDPAAAEVARVPGVTVTLCDSAHWAATPLGRRPDMIEDRQTANAAMAYAQSDCDWFIHIDADEYVYGQEDPGHVLARCDDLDVVRLEPAEVMIAPRQRPLTVFRHALPRTKQGQWLGQRVYGEVYPLLEGGLLGHAEGKFFVRGQRQAVEIRIHAPMIDGKRQRGKSVEGLRLLHFHGADTDAWIARLQQRLDTGAYHPRHHDKRKRRGKLNGMGRNAYLRKIAETEGEDGLRRFHQGVCSFTREARLLKRADALIKLRLWQEEKRETWFPTKKPLAARKVAMNPQTGQLEAEVTFRGMTIAAALEDNYTEMQLAAGIEPEGPEMDRFLELVRDRKVRFWDIGGNAGVYTLLCARHARADSTITAFEPNPTMLSRLRRNLEKNGLANAQAFGLALGPGLGTVRLNLPGDMGLATIANAGDVPGIEVPMRPLSHFVPSLRDDATWVMKIDIEGAEPEVLTPFFRDAAPELWPEFILYEHAHSTGWSSPPDSVFPADAYTVDAEFRHNTLLRRNEAALSTGLPDPQDAFARALSRAAR